jgi:adenine-specific DNA-methyltransferase
MGSKRSLAPSIAARISSEYPARPVLDVFAGMCAVGHELAPAHPVLTNDIHRFAHTVASALFVEPASCPTSLIARDELLSAYRRNRDALRTLMADKILSERVAIARSVEPNGWRLFVADHQRAVDEGHPLQAPFEELESYRRDPTLFPYSLFSRYFSHGYFGVEQAVDLDSLRYAIDQGPEEHRRFYLTALLTSASHCATAPGHFAQFLEPRDASNTKYIVRIRSRSIYDRFLEALDYFEAPNCLDRTRNFAYNMEATKLVRSLADTGPGAPVIYADPPYSRAQYSRYYHVLETLVAYDYPECTDKGRYRHDRFQTSFSHRAKVIHAFSDFVDACYDLGSPLYISYPSNGLLGDAGGNIADIMSGRYSSVTLIERVVLSHSTMGGAPGVASMPVYEEVYHAKPS